MTDQQILLQIDGVTKVFPGVRALDRVTLHYEGELVIAAQYSVTEFPSCSYHSTLWSVLT